jgi:hypothetical protein
LNKFCAGLKGSLALELTQLYDEWSHRNYIVYVLGEFKIDVMIKEEEEEEYALRNLKIRT